MYDSHDPRLLSPTGSRPAPSSYVYIKACTSINHRLPPSYRLPPGPFLHAIAKYNKSTYPRILLTIITLMHNAYYQYTIA